MSLRRTISREVQALSYRAGYPIMPRWRLARWHDAQHLRELFLLLSIDCVLDVGANIGQYHDYLRLHVGYEGHVVSFEPVGELFTQLERAAGSDPLWSVHRMALGKVSATAEIQVFAERTLSSFLPRNEASLQAMGYEKYLRETELDRTEEVLVRRLDEIFDSVMPKGVRGIFLKSDTQGTDLAVVRGAAARLDRIGGMQIELPVREVYQGATNYMDGIAELTQLGYDVTAFMPVQRDGTLRVINVDCVLINHAVAERLRAEHRHAPGHAGRP
jgi:FkbM family methyltransferase